MSETRKLGVSLGNLEKEIVEINKTLCSLDLLVLFHQGKSTRKFWTSKKVQKEISIKGKVIKIS